MNKFEEMMNGSIKNPTSEQIQEALKDTITSFTSIKDLNEFLIKLHPSDAYKAIRDIVQPKTNFIIRNEQKNKTEDYQRFQNIQQEAKKIYEYEHKHATIFDVQNIATGIAQQMYGIAIRMISKVDDELGRVEHTVNTIEEHLGLDVTKFEEECDYGDTTKTDDEQRSEEVTE